MAVSTSHHDKNKQQQKKKTKRQEMVLNAELAFHGIVHRVGGDATSVCDYVLRQRRQILRDFYALCDDDGADGLFAEAQVREGLLYVLEDVRQGIYVLFRGGRPRLVAVVCNILFENRWDTFPTTTAIEVCEKGALSSKNWWTSNGILCTTPADSHYGWGLGMIMDVFALLMDLATEEIYDAEFILNRRDLPMVRRDGQSCFADFVTCPPPRRHNPSLPVLSLFQGGEWRDLPLIEPTFVNEPLPEVPWDEKKRVVFFRGSCTGRGVTAETNPRIALATFSFEQNDETAFDCKLTGLSKRLKFTAKNVVEKDDLRNVPPLGERVDMNRWSEYKFLVYVEGYSAALRMMPMLSARSVIFFLQNGGMSSTAPDLWFFDKLVFADWYETFHTQKLSPTNANMILVEDPSAISYFLPTLLAHDDIAKELADNAFCLWRELKSSRSSFFASTINQAKKKWL